MKKYTHSHRLYLNLWKSSEIKHSSITQKQEPSPELALIDEICFKADLCESYEEYVNTLCEGMILLLEAGISQSYMDKHPVLKSKIYSMGDDILKNSYQDSNQLYVGVFVKLRVKLDWLKIKFYKVVKNMLHHVLDRGLKISDHIKIKLKEQLRCEDFALYKMIFLNNSIVQAF